MMQLLENPLIARAAVVGVFGGAGLALTSIYSRRGPMIYPAYAALLAALAFLLARNSQFSYGVRTVAALTGFSVATLISYVTVGVLSARHRRALIDAGRLPPGAGGASVWGHAWRWAFLLGVGAVVSAAVAFVSA